MIYGTKSCTRIFQYNLEITRQMLRLTFRSKFSTNILLFKSIEIKFVISCFVECMQFRKLHRINICVLI